MSRWFVGCACVCAAAWFAAGCKSLDRSLLDAPDTGIADAGKDSGPPDAQLPIPDGGGDAGDGSVCKKKTESCNGKDDDCDGKTDEGGDQWCADNVIQNATAVCSPMGDTAVCYRLKCFEGYDSCDGDPANGCESPYCDCHVCDDAGMDDAGL